MRGEKCKRKEKRRLWEEEERKRRNKELVNEDKVRGRREEGKGREGKWERKEGSEVVDWKEGDSRKRRTERVSGSRLFDEGGRKKCRRKHKRDPKSFPVDKRNIDSLEEEKSQEPAIESKMAESKPRERSRWEIESRSPNDRFRREGSLVRAIKGEKKDEVEPKWGKKNEGNAGKQPIENKAKPDFGLSGKLAQDTNMFNGVIIKYNEPPDARKPKRRWRLYPFKGDATLATLYIHRQSAYLIGRDRKVADLPVDHPSCSKQHAVLQYRAVPKPSGPGLRVAPYIIDLESANGTYINNVKVDPRKYVELFEKDVIKFAYSSREYVLLHEHSKDDEEADDGIQE